MGNNTSVILPVVILIVAVGIGVPYMIKKKKQERARALISSRKNKDEVWRTIKQYLKDMNRYGEEIVDSYVAKRNPIDYINPSAPNIVRKKQRDTNKIRDFQYKKDKNNQSINKFSKPKMRDLYVVCFSTKNIKTNKINPPEAIECEVVTKKIDRKNSVRKIYINGKLDYDKEMQWIAPLRASELEKNNKIEKKQAVHQEKIRRRMEKMKQKKADKNIKHNG